MADVITQANSSAKKSAGVKKLKRKATAIDLTPMVDLGFLLITFFIFTATISQATAMKLVLPNDQVPDNTTPIKESGALTLVLSAHNTVYYYEGKLDENGLNIHSGTATEIRNVIIKKKRNTLPADLFVTIKPGKHCIYSNIVNMLDEMTINDIKKFALADIAEPEEQLMEKMEAGKR